MDTAAIREESVEQARRLGHPVSSGLPLLESDLRLRAESDVIRRCLARHVAVAVAYGFDRQAALDWLAREGLIDALAPSERESLDQDDDPQLQPGVESLWAFCWALGLVDDLDFGEVCGDSLISLFPDLLVGADSAPFAAVTELRSIVEIAHAVDLAYCLHWSIIEAALTGESASTRVHGGAVIERRHALEWLISEEDWDEVSLDT